MNSIFSNAKFRLGVLGGGQLGKMLLTETRRYDIFTAVLDPSADAPCRMACNEFTQGSLKDYDTVLNFGRKVDVLTIEIEHVNVDALETLESEGVKVYPQPRVLRTIQNKVVQKEFYRDNNIPTSPFTRFDNKQGVIDAISKGDFTLPVVWKAATGGYDGFGVSVLRSQEDINALPDQAGMLEAFVPFDKELSVIVARRPSGEVKTYPVVEMEFHPTANQVEYVICPSSIEPDLAAKASQVAMDVIKAYDLVGLLAVEMFLTKDGEILVNEVAPRTHNSGHLTIESNFTSQFEQHLRAVCDLPLGNTDIRIPGVMANLVGAADFSGQVIYDGYLDALGMRGVYIHIYGKSETRPFRKMGHVTATNTDVKEARRMAEMAKDSIVVRA